MPNLEIEEIGGGPGGQALRIFLAVAHNDDGTLKNAGSATLAGVLAASNDAGALKIVNLAEPVSAQDAATKHYVDAIVVTAQTLAAVLAAGHDAGAVAITNLGAPTLSGDAATKGYVDGVVGGASSLNAVLVIGNDAGAHKITNLGTPTVASDAVTKAYADAINLAAVLAAGSTAGGIRITSLGAPIVSTDAATKAYVDALTLTLAQVLAAGHDANGVVITNLGTPVNDTDAVTKAYVDTPTFTTVAGPAYTLLLSDKDNIIVATNGTAATITVPANASVAFPLGTRIPIRAGVSAGTISIPSAPGGGVSIVNPYYPSPPTNYVLAGGAAEAMLTKVGTDTWGINGEIV